jgi:hypothetical protein
MTLAAGSARHGEVGGPGQQLVISPLTRSGPDQTEKWAEKVYALLPRIHLTHLLEEVDGWTHFTGSCRDQ